MLTIHRAERADALVAGLAELLRGPGASLDAPAQPEPDHDDPLRPETVAVPSRGVERWLAQQLSRVLGAGPAGDGVCANVLFPSFTTVVDDALIAADDDYATAVEAWDPQRVIWPLLEIIDRDATTEPYLAVLGAHLVAAGGADRGRRVSVAGKIARLFDRYGRSRPDLLIGWLAGRDEVDDDLRWQPELWRRLRGVLDVPAPAERLSAACARVGSGPPFSIFGATRISPARVRALGAIAAQRDVHLWLHHPSPSLWESVRGEAPGRRRDQRPVARNPLLASMSRDVRELQQLLGTVAHTDEHLSPVGSPARPQSLLVRLQRELAGDTVATTRGPTDRTVSVHSAHGPARQVEVVREVVLGLLADDPTLEPRDIVIMCPDVETFAPLVAAAFGAAESSGGHPAAALRVRLADRSLRLTNPLLGLLGQLIDLANGRVGAAELLDLAGQPPVRRRFGFDDDDLERLRSWTVAAGARWGLDAEHRARYGLRSLAQNTWRSAVDRLLLGVAMQEDGSWVGDTVPLDDVDSTDIDLAGRFAEFVDRAGIAVDELCGRHSAGEWAALLVETVTALGEPDETWQLIQLRRQLGELAENAPPTSTAFGLADLAALLHERLAGRPTRASFRTGTLTVCTLVPMRSVPHRVIVLMGLDDGAFPRRGIADGDDVLARDPCSGERDVRSEDRQLFLDAICAAQEHLVISYTGADPRTGAEIPPCVPLGELLDALDATAVGPDGAPARDEVIVRHPLQPFDRRNFQVGTLGRPAPFSFDTLALSGARAAAGTRVAPAPLAGVRLPRVAPAAVALDDLVRFFAHPIRGFLRQRLELATYSDDDDPSDSMTVELDPLAGWAVGERMLRRCLAGVPRQVAAALEYRRGELPPAALGAAQLRIITGRIDALLRSCGAERREPARSIDVHLDLDGRSVVGTVGGLRGDTLLAVSYSTLAAKHRMTAWIGYLALVAGGEGDGLRAVTVGRSGDDASRSELDGVRADLARDCLALLVDIRERGLREPLPLALRTSAEYADKRQRGYVVANAETAAARRWTSSMRFPGEQADPEHVLVFGGEVPFARLRAEPATGADTFPDEQTRFGALARMVWEPLLAVERFT